jgi:ribosomal protein S9
MDSKIELIFQKKNIGLGKRKESTARFPYSRRGNIIINKISGNKYLQYNDTYLTTVWSPLEKLNLENNLILWR